MIYSLEWEKRAIQELNDLDYLISQRIVKKTNEFVNNFSFHNIKRIVGEENKYRLRVGDYRVIFEIKDTSIRILKIGHRKNIYKN